EQQHIRTAHGFGYQFVSEVEILDSPALAEVGRSDRGGAESLPQYHTPLRGRDEERREVADLVERYRVVTLLGPGGIGKTRLAGEGAREDTTARGAALL